MPVSLTIIIIIVTVLISIRAENNPELKSRLVMNAYQVRHYNQYYRLLTSGFIHSGYVHLGFNMFALYCFGEHLERVMDYYFGPLIGSILFIAFYLISIVLSDLKSLFKYSNYQGYNSLGASGGVAAVLFAFIMFYPLAEISLMFIPIGIEGFILGTLYLIYSYFQGKNLGDKINHDAHMFGALCGIAFSIIIHPKVVIEFFQQIMNWPGLF
ncbi:MAG: rhomboid family intramembrane serine protease [bacterium]|nr:rhomboid family intramembrane serine protease [bacterium]